MGSYKKVCAIAVAILISFALGGAVFAQQTRSKDKPMSQQELQDLVLQQQKVIEELKQQISELRRAAALAGGADVSGVYEKVKSAVVVVFCHGQRVNADDLPFDIVPRRGVLKRRGQGSGVIVDPDGYIITCHHVVANGESLEVRTTDGKIYPAEIVAEYQYADLALLKIKAADLTAIKLGDSDSLKIGQLVMALGNPFGVSAEDAQPSLSVGVVSGLHKIVPKDDSHLYSDAIQTDAALNPGNSGGPLIDMDGRLVGINGLIRSSSMSNAGVGFAMPVNLIKLVLDDMKRGKNIFWGYTGIIFEDINAEEARKLGETAVRIQRIVENSPGAEMAKKIGFGPGDFLTKLNGKQIKNSHHLTNILTYLPAGSKVEMCIRRGNANHVFALTTVSEILSPFERKSKEALDLLVAKKYKEAYNLYKGLLDDEPENTTNLYNMACACSLLGKKKEAIDYLRRAMEAGFENLEHIKKDPDLENIRNDRAFRELMSEYENKFEEDDGE